MPGHNPASLHSISAAPGTCPGAPHSEPVVQPTPPTLLDETAGDAGDVLADQSFDAFAGPAPTAAAPERVRTRRGGPHAPLPLLPLIGLCAGIGIAYVAQTAHLTQTSYQQSTLAAQQADLQRQDAQLADDLARLRSPVRIDAAAQRLGLRPPSKWIYVAAAPAPIAPPATITASTATPAGSDPLGHVVEAMVGSFGPTGSSGAGTSSAGRAP